MSTQDVAPSQSSQPPASADKKKRPISITIIAWFIIVGGGISLVQIPWISSKPEFQRVLEAMYPGMSVTMSIAITMVGSTVGLVAGIAMLKAKNWGRIIYLGYTPTVSVITWALYGFHPFYIPGIVFYVVVLVFLTRQAASTFFGGAVFRQS